MTKGKRRWANRQAKTKRKRTCSRSSNSNIQVGYLRYLFLVRGIPDLLTQFGVNRNGFFERQDGVGCWNILGVEKGSCYSQKCEVDWIVSRYK